MVERGRFFVIEGTDGSGKKTQLDILATRAETQLGLNVVKLDFPQYETSFFGALVGRYLNGDFGANSEINPYLSTVLYAADRWQAKGIIETALSEGKIVLSNRYVLSNIGHQVPKVSESEQAKLKDHIYEMEYRVFGIPQEDLNIFLYVPPDVAQQLVDKKAARSHLGEKKRDIHEADIDHLRKSVEMYQRVASEFPDRVVMVNCTENGNLLPIETISDKIWEIFSENVSNNVR